ncbi:MAG: hypothetical protein US53_C0018G0015 [Candidatus Woesebacteria bacterium GW2011_GWA1_37_7]|uniref:Uncharacterized protein n=2 Tax=Candidatus Woeseibacteriota TaxID=1752722 RepID=A0A0G0H5R1_9BACT|nr:MAG: hypothetical protein US53_C0018G0015 [Candidatus Woesebacteria bacterium GW2011_GWA1_37_7]OGM17949.1 MAG: hypothetical protein A2685_02530 [Candidatus Woesebacteria bacterium RIFCSPHIGHO2_01_FULL_37_10]
MEGKGEKSWRVEVYKKPGFLGLVRFPLIDSLLAETVGRKVCTAGREMSREDAYKKALEVEGTKGKRYSAIPVPSSR